VEAKVSIQKSVSDHQKKAKKNNKKIKKINTKSITPTSRSAWSLLQQHFFL
jgi:hypothetical protein